MITHAQLIEAVRGIAAWSDCLVNDTERGEQPCGKCAVCLGVILLARIEGEPEPKVLAEGYIYEIQLGTDQVTVFRTPMGFCCPVTIIEREA